MKQTLKPLYNFIIGISYAITIIGSITLALYLLSLEQKGVIEIIAIIAFFALALFTVLQGIRFIKMKMKHK
ncbi:MAG: hypothetical protein U9Q18_00265 [Caldisericota bacterium]|nr:hypothetical protein [Caldisericota bacterium]